MAGISCSCGWKGRLIGFIRNKLLRAFFFLLYNRPSPPLVAINFLQIPRPLSVFQLLCENVLKNKNASDTPFWHHSSFSLPLTIWKLPAVAHSLITGCEMGTYFKHTIITQPVWFWWWNNVHHDFPLSDFLFRAVHFIFPLFLFCPSCKLFGLLCSIKWTYG